MIKRILVIVFIGFFTSICINASEGDALRAEADNALENGDIETALDSYIALVEIEPENGEALEFAAPLNISSRPRGLRVLVPAGTRPGYLPPGQVIAAKLLDLAAVGGHVEVDVTST